MCVCVCLVSVCVCCWHRFVWCLFLGRRIGRRKTHRPTTHMATYICTTSLMLHPSLCQCVLLGVWWGATLPSLIPRSRPLTVGGDHATNTNTVGPTTTPNTSAEGKTPYTLTHIFVCTLSLLPSRSLPCPVLTGGVTLVARAHSGTQELPIDTPTPAKPTHITARNSEIAIHLLPGHSSLPLLLRWLVL